MLIPNLFVIVFISLSHFSKFLITNFFSPSQKISAQKISASFSAVLGFSVDLKKSLAISLTFPPTFNLP